jgi:hypothetical protein
VGANQHTFVPYTEQEITDVLMAVIANAGNCAAAERSLREQGKRAPKPGTISQWVKYAHAGQYMELRDKYAEQIEGQLVHEYRDVIARATEGAKLAIDSAVTALESGFDKEPSRTAANLATVADKYTRDMLTLQGRPTRITENRDVNEIVRALEARGIRLIADAESLELPEGDGNAD